MLKMAIPMVGLITFIYSVIFMSDVVSIETLRPTREGQRWRLQKDGTEKVLAILKGARHKRFQVVLMQDP